MNMRAASKANLASTSILDDNEDTQSGIRSLDRLERETAERGALRVTLTILKWENARPGVLSWQFDSIAAAHTAVKAFRNALTWAIFPASYASFEAAKRAGDVVLTSEERVT
jgi:hypothetical protein